MVKKIEKHILGEKCRHLKSVAKELILEREVSTFFREALTPKVSDLKLENEVSTPDIKSVDT